ncbi:MAG: hypothetical protein U5K54_23330 [Cytophagales bacterium]|nr:hypothetical protein [Cytophagales bacterium]
MALWVRYFLQIFDHYDKKYEVRDLNRKYNGINANLESVISNYDSIRNSYDSIKKWQTKLNDQLIPFLSLATKKYPKINQDSALKRLYNSMIVKGDAVISNNQSGGITAHTVVPNALIFTKGQSGGNNTVVTPTVELPPPKYEIKWVVKNKTVHSFNERRSPNPRDSVKLPTDKYPYKYCIIIKLLLVMNQKSAEAELDLY